MIFILCGLLITGAVFEEIYIKNSIKEIKQQVTSLEEEINKQYNSTSAFDILNNMQNYWAKREKVLCLVVNYKEIKEIYLQMHRLEETMLQNDQENTHIELNVLKYNINGCSNVIGFNIQNVF